MRSPKRLTTRLSTLLRALNPDTYPKLCAELDLKEVLQHVVFSFVFFVLLMTLLFIPAALYGAHGLAERLSTFDEFTLGGTYEAERITLLGTPHVAIDLTENASLTDERVLLTQEGVQYKRYYLAGDSLLPWAELDARDPPEGLFTALFLFLLPSIIIWTALFHLSKYVLLVGIVALLATGAPHLFRFRISPANAAKVALLAATVLMLELPLFPFWRNGWVALGLYLLFVILGVLLVGDRKLGKRSDPWK